MTVPLPTDVDTLGKLALFEYGRAKLGYGDWTIDSDQPYRQWAGAMCHRLWLVMNKRRISNSEFIACVDYCHATRKRIENPVWVFKYIGEAKAWITAQSAPTDTETQVEQAVAAEHALGAPDSSEWIGRLVRARGDYRKEVLSEWQLHRSK